MLKIIVFRVWSNKGAMMEMVRLSRATLRKRARRPCHCIGYKPVHCIGYKPVPLLSRKRHYERIDWMMLEMSL